MEGASPLMASRRAVILTSSRFSHPTQLLSRQQSAPVSPLTATLMNLSASIANKELTENLSLLDSTLTKNRGEGGVMVNQLHPVSQRSIALTKRPLFSVASTLFHFSYPVSPVFATLTKTTGVYSNNSHSGTSGRPAVLKYCVVSMADSAERSNPDDQTQKKNYDWSINRWWMAYKASSRRSETPSLSKMLWRWFLTVCSEMKSFSPISLLRNPCATS